MNREGRYTSLQLFRIVACIGVFCVHFGQRVQLGGVIRSFTDFGRYGVQMFFIISGLLAAKGLDEKSSTSDAIRYYEKRIINIAPLYYFVILWYFITENLLEIVWPHIPVDTANLGWFRYLFLLNGFVTNDTYFWSNLGITWTIPIFAFFYLLAPWVMRFVRDYKSALIALVIVFICTRISLRLYYCTIFANLYLFFIGILLFFCWKANLLMPCAFGFTALATVYLILGKGCYPELFAAMICCGLEREIELPEKLQKIVDRIDEHSYTLYLVHGMLFCSLIDRLRAERFGVPKVIIGAIAIVGTFIGTIVIHRFVEKPTQRFIKMKWFE